ncbi:hypothetical protein CEE37_11750 [candidate division LCP-89 bacterium B3_LCP]|uniref:Secretion system C-terminal sorting domain-containing protein n=1 Tax=candidate division LCP-89 bacterium B3_LCP TaxID=2012998 RepID=A0A532UVX2_UNCL8|nr:MAG: hypothetical protein CEE37_11750 [candidate division LCP-89 bacterium B3_LCP]
MKYTIIFLLLPLVAFAQEFEFQQELDTIPIEIDGYQLPYPWLGGFALTNPALVDIDADGLYEMVMSNNKGGLYYLENDGTPQVPDFYIEEEEWQGIDLNMGLFPFFCDIDADSDLDLILETVSLPIYIYENVGTIYDPVFELLEDMVEDTSGTPIEGTFGDLVDIDGDGDYDFFTGNWYSCTISFYENVGDSSSYAFALVTTNFQGISTNGYKNYLEFCDIDADGDWDLYIGTDEGYIYYFRNDSVLPDYTFTCLSTNYLGEDVGDDANPEFCDIDADGDFDLFVGKGNEYDHNDNGDMQFWRNEGTMEVSNFVQENQMYLTFDIAGADEPDFVDYNYDSDMDLYVLYKYIALLSNVGNAEDPSFQVVDLEMVGSGFLASSNDYGDLNDDGDEDMVVAGGWSGIVGFWECDGDTSLPGFTEQTSIDVGCLLGSPALGDLDADGDLDMILSATNWSSFWNFYYENQGTPEHFNYVLIDSNFQGIYIDEGAVPSLVDFDFDGDLDLMLGGIGYSAVNYIWYYENQGTPEVPDMVLVSQDLLGLGEINTGYGVEFVDIDNDMDFDVFAGTEAGGIKFYRNITEHAEVGPKRPIGPPKYSIDSDLTHNPQQSLFTFTLPSPQNVTLAVYNLLGRKITTIVSGSQPAGTHSFLWNPSSQASGVYIIRLETAQEAVAKRVMVVR